jgi:hypothetical protein
MFIWYYKGRLFWFHYSDFQVVGGHEDTQTYKLKGNFISLKIRKVG